MKRIFAVLALIVLSISPVLADAGLIAPGHVLGNPDNYARTPTDTSILSVIQAAGYYAPVPLATGGADNATAINAAITAAAAQGGGTVQLACGGSASNPFWFSQIVMVSNVYLKGCGKDATFLKQIANSNKGAIIGPSNFSSLVGTGLPNGGSTLTGLQFVGVSDLTVDGNISNNTSGDCLDIYGRYLVVEHIRLTNCANKGMWSEWGLGYSGPPTNPTTFDNGLEGFYSDIHIWKLVL